MKRLTTLALLAGMFSIPALHGEEAPADRSAPLNFHYRARPRAAFPPMSRRRPPQRSRRPQRRFR